MLAQEVEELAAGEQVDEEVELLGVLEGVVELDDERVVHVLENIALGHCVRLLVLGLDLRLRDYLHRIELLYQYTYINVHLPSSFTIYTCPNEPFPRLLTILKSVIFFFIADKELVGFLICTN